MEVRRGEKEGTLLRSSRNAAAVADAGVQDAILGPLILDALLRPERPDLLLALTDEARCLHLAGDRREQRCGQPDDHRGHCFSKCGHGTLPCEINYGRSEERRV